ncbi:MAG: ankyrin repeat domain-containing protein [Planctomycetota bacterium]
MDLPLLAHAVLEETAGADMVRALLELGADPNLAERGRGWTPLYFAAQSNAFDAMRVLLEFGSDHSVVDVYRKTALHIATSNARGDLTGVRALLRAGADPYVEDRYGNSPRAIAEIIANFHTRDAFVDL